MDRFCRGGRVLLSQHWPSPTPGIVRQVESLAGAETALERLPVCLSLPSLGELFEELSG